MHNAMIYDIVASVMVREGMSSSTLPDDPETLKSLVLTLDAEKQSLLVEKEQALAVKESELAEKEKENRILREQLRLLKKWRFARSSEQWTEEDRKQLRLFDEAEAVMYAAEQRERETEEIHYRRRKPRRRGISKDLPRRVIVHELTEEQRRCTKRECGKWASCGKLRPVIGEEPTELVDFIPAQIWVNHHVWRKYGPIECEEFKTDESQPTVIEAPREKRIVEGGMVTASLLSHVIVSKFADALPFYRQERILRRIGLEVSRQTMSGWTIRAARASEEYLELLREKVREGPLINVDETPVRVLEEPHNGKNGKSYMWVMVGSVGEGRRVVLYHYSAKRSGEVAKGLLEGYRGAVQTDGYTAYGEVNRRKEIWDVGCLAHVRRKFYDAWEGAGKKGLAGEGVKKIRKVYEIERELRRAGLSEEEFTLERRRRAAPVLREFRKWMEGLSKTVVPESLLGKAVRYGLNEYRRVVKYLKYGYLRPDNNAAERAIRPFAVGRRNWLFNNTPLGAHASAAMFSMIETAKGCNKDPFHFLNRLFTELPKAETREDLEKLLPWNMEGLPPYKADTGQN